MKQRKQGFSLIELLVVMSILAILASILYPVLRRAQESAKKTVCAVQFREVGLAAAIYLGDNDDRYMPASYGQTSAQTNDRKWPQILQPYIKDQNIFRCPSDSTPASLPSASFDEDLINIDPQEADYEMAKRVNTGLNYLYLAPIVRAENGQWVSTPKSLSEVETPISSIFAVDSAYELDGAGKPKGGGSYLVVPPCRYAPLPSGKDDTMRLPNAEIFLSNSGWSKEANRIKRFGGAYPWHEGRMTVLYMDLRAIPRTPEHLAQGCQISQGFDSLISDLKEYDWDLN